MKAVTFLIKPASGLCNLRCRYCFYHDLSKNRSEGHSGIMTAETAEALIRAAFAEAGEQGFVQFTFQGGEPTLAGLDFYRTFLALEEKYRPRGLQTGHAIQTNGIVLDQEWVTFLKENRFLVGLSIDGNQSIHDLHRVDAQGRGTWHTVRTALSLLDEAGVETNLLCVVTAAAAKHPQKLYTFLRDLGGHPLQFIPCLDPMEQLRGKESYSLTPEVYGRFLCSLFDLWYRDWKSGRYLSIRLFDDYLRLLLGMTPGSCASSGRCGSYLVAESDGSLYPCDFYVLDPWKLGNIRDMTVSEALSCDLSKAFHAERLPCPENCKSCSWLPICRTGCKRDWTPQRENYYCPAFRKFFPYALPRLQEMARSLTRR